MMKLSLALVASVGMLCSCSSSGTAPATPRQADVRPSPTVGAGMPAPAAASMQEARTEIRSSAPASPAGTLYQRLGGYDAVSAVTDEFLRRIVTDHQVGRYFIGLSHSSKDILRQHIVEFLCHETGGPCSYVGRGLDEVHTGLGITESDWQIAVRELVATLDQFHVPSREKGELVAAVAKFKDDIVGK